MAGTEYSGNYGCAHEFFVSLEKFGSSDALLSPGRTSLTFERLCAQVNRIMSQLNEYGLGRNDQIVIALPNGPELAVALMSVIAGFTCVPLNHAYKKQESELCLDGLNARALIVQAGTGSALRDAAKMKNIPLVELVPLYNSCAGLFDLYIPSHFTGQPSDTGYAEPDDTALIMNTSGTTSRPKVIPWSQKKLFSSISTVSRYFELSMEDRCLNVMPLFHLHGLISCLLASLYRGGSVVCTQEFAQESFWEWIEQYQPTWYSGVAAIHQSVLQCAGKDPEKADKAGLRFIRHSSSPLSQSVINGLEEKFSAPVIEVYGMTEITPITINPLAPEKRKPGSAGPSAGPEVRIIDKYRNFLPAGEDGEIVIRGEYITGLSESTGHGADRFMDGWFRTGDQGCMDSDGYLFIKDRVTEIINQGGHKISPCEIDETVIEHPFVREASAFAVPHRSLGETVAVAVVPESKGCVSEKEIRAYISDRLSSYKVPKQVLLVENIPKSEIGKVQRRELYGKFSHLLKHEFVPPVRQTGIAIAGIWEEVLGVQRVGLLDSIFSLGGDSLHATRIATRINEHFNITLSLQRVFEAPNVEELALIVEEALQSLSEMSETGSAGTGDYEEGSI